MAARPNAVPVSNRSLTLEQRRLAEEVAALEFYDEMISASRDGVDTEVLIARSEARYGEETDDVSGVVRFGRADAWQAR